MIVGLTGGLASGKDLVATYLKEFGAVIIDADKIAREIIEPGEEAYSEIVSIFGDKVVRKDGRIDRAALGEIVFSDRALLNKLNDIMLPRIIEEEKRRIGAVQKNNRGATIVINAPLLIESGHYRDMERVIVVDIDEQLQIERAGQKGYTRETARARMKSQITREKRLSHADFIIDNSGNRQTTRDRTSKVFAELRKAT
ncbi:MAG: dephospho-CoA kinase [Deltaproteobacteria bacterium]|nr:dephospho-CoA kinase [Deltaproteobacteria bacterium]